MRSIVKCGLAAMGVALLMACSHESQPASNPQPQQPAMNTTPQLPNDPMAENGINHQSTTPMDSPNAQNSTMGTAGPQQPFNEPSVQKPFGMSSDNDQNKILAKTEKPLSDAEILGVVLTANQGEVEMADMAVKKATDKDVKSFAVMMKTMHTQGATKTKSTETKTKITHQDSDLTSFLKSDVQKTENDLRDKTGSDFDKSYIDAQVTAHKNVLAAIDNRLIPSATNSEVKSLLTETRKVVVDHIAKAEEVQKKVGSVAVMDNVDTTANKPSALPGGDRSVKAKGVEARP